MTVADHIQKVLKPNFAAAWEEVGDDFEKEETFALSSIKNLDGEMISPRLLVTHPGKAAVLGIYLVWEEENWYLPT